MSVPRPPFPVPGGKLCERGKSIAGTHWRVKGQSAEGPAGSWPSISTPGHPRPAAAPAPGALTFVHFVFLDNLQSESTSFLHPSRLRSSASGQRGSQSPRLPAPSVARGLAWLAGCQLWLFSSAWQLCGGWSARSSLPFACPCFWGILALPGAPRVGECSGLRVAGGCPP